MVDLEQHIKQIEALDGKRIWRFEELKLPKGWVVSKSVPENFWEICKTEVIPMKALKILGIFPTPASQQMASWQEHLGKDIIAVLVRTDSGHLGGPVLIQDLKGDPDKLLEEALKALGKDDQLLWTAKEIAARLLTGWVDLR